MWTAPPKPRDKVRCVRGHADSRVLETGKVYTVAVVVSSGIDYYGHCEGVIVWDKDAPVYPYVWDLDRFEPAE